MINTYSTTMIAVQVTKKIDRGTTILEVIAEYTDQAIPSEFPITFIGAMADKASEEIIKGVRFTYRGIVRIEDGRIQLLGLTFARIN